MSSSGRRAREPAWLDRKAYPFERNYIDVGPGRMHFVDEGSGPTVLFVHGNPTWSFMYRRCILRMSASRRCIAPDLVGFGLSDRPAGWSYSPEDQAACLRRLLDELDLDEIAIVVHDWGGPIGLDAAFRSGCAIRCCVILNTIMWPIASWSRLGIFARTFGSSVGSVATRRANVLARLMPFGIGDRKAFPSTVHRQYIEPLRDDAAASAALPGAFLQSAPFLDGLWARRSNLKAIPTHIMWGMKDPVFRTSHLDRWRSALSDAHVTTLGEVGHFVAEEAPYHVTHALEQSERCSSR
ncbi:MAG: alpha/beta fold hydrolase [Rhodothermales bacterium]